MRETAITIDHDSGRIRADTTSKRMRSIFLRAGLTEITKSAELGPYWSFEGPESLIRVGRRRKGIKGKQPAGFLASKKTPQRTKVGVK